jgi:sigma-B regulation protein RsbU (phosphoserine phosphatase)
MGEKILIVDDSEDLRKLLSLMLVKTGHEVAEAADGDDALKKAHEYKPDLILLDIVMPLLDGYEVCKNLKNDEHTTHIPIIFLSGKTDAADKIKGLEIGGIDYITKPFNKGEVVARVQNQLKIQRLTRELLERNKELTEKQKLLDEDLIAAGEIQKSLLPLKSPDVKHLDIAWKFIPSYLIGGDIFNFLQLDEENVGFYMIDVSGHGVPSAMVTASVSQILQPQNSSVTKKKIDEYPGYEIVSPREVFEILDAEYPLSRFEKYFTMVYAIINVQDGNILYSNAAHPPPILLRNDGSCELFEAGGTIIGMGGILPFEEEQKSLNNGDKIIFYTDGVTEFQNHQGEFYGEERFLTILKENRDKKIEALIDAVMKSIKDFGADAEFQDDISLLGIEYRKQGL